ncbi:prolyl oligopeptidase family serine peptidase [Pseudomonas sp. KNUC1026]|uniref:prolyl oligopeptidase family serine peptidase n=1 Tax=Pseudomonas sp. KNUC1026 TaxID=2893890 RepID=UPI001F20E750|nr:prolyl oligopeptidase family serine peptidase [Pseudomonas sp. KNUC1026]UFH48097.1 prolyl oligopeptidase family serine peptidase [Pseudomonas sp. KNUC1026]
MLKAYPVQGNFDSTRYLSKRLWATSADGTRIPISITLRADHQHRGALRLVLSGYGAYGVTQEPEFSYSALSLLDRGFALATAHVRGGGMLGQAWHAAGQGLNKQRSFDDFIACAEYLIEEGWTTAEALVIHGASAGGLLVGAVLDRRPELFRAAIARQPFVDVLTAMSDPDLALTTQEYQEWGDPRQAEQNAEIRRWSPYENVSNQAYPALLVSAGLLDRQVPYWQPAKWVARLRERKVDDHLLLLMTDLQGVHGAPFARNDRIRRDAVEYAFMFKALGLAEHAPGD